MPCPCMSLSMSQEICKLFSEIPIVRSFYMKMIENSSTNGNRMLHGRFDLNRIKILNFGNSYVTVTSIYKKNTKKIVLVQKKYYFLAASHLEFNKNTFSRVDHSRTLFAVFKFSSSLDFYNFHFFQFL